MTRICCEVSVMLHNIISAKPSFHLLNNDKLQFFNNNKNPKLLWPNNWMIHDMIFPCTMISQQSKDQLELWTVQYVLQAKWSWLFND
jgi:hypothetical protein